MHLAAVLVLAILGLADDAPRPIEVKAPTQSGPASYAKGVADVLDAKCAGCHGSALAENKLNLETIAGMRKGGKRGPALVPGKADESLLFKMAAHRIAPAMPPEKKKDLPPLTPEELGLLKQWIDGGARDDSEPSPAPAKPPELGPLPSGVHPINALDLTPDGHRVASGRANVVEVFDVDSGASIISLGGHRDLIQSVRFAPDARRLAAGSFGVVTLWDCPLVTARTTFAGSPEPIKAMVATRDGKALITGGPEKAIRFWNTADGKILRTVSLLAGTTSLALSADDSLVAAVGSDGAVRIIKVADGKQRHVLNVQGATLTSADFLPEGESMVTLGNDGTARIWAPPSKPGEPAASRTINLDSKKPVGAMLVLKEGTLLIATRDAKARLVDPANGKETRSFPLATGPVLALALSPGGKSVLVGSEDRLARLYDLDSGRLIATFGPHGGPVRSVAFSPKGDRAVTSADGVVKVWDIATGRGVIAFAYPAAKAGDPSPAVQSSLLLGGGRLVAAAEKTARMWTVEGTWADVRTFGTHVFRILAIDFSPDGKLMATGGGEPSRTGEVKVWDVATGKLVRSLDNLHSDTVFALRFSPDGTKLASASADKYLKVVNVADGKELKSFEGHTHHVLALDWSGDGKRLVTGGADSVVKVWDFESGEQFRTLNQAGKGVTGLRWVPGKPLLFGASGDSNVRAWNPDNGSVLRTLSGASDYLFAVAASADGNRVAAGGADGVLLLWNGATGSLLRKIPDSK
jgi:WD40 repeat protein